MFNECRLQSKVTLWMLHDRCLQSEVTIQSVIAAVPPPGSIQYEPHALDSAPSPLLQTLPNYERQFRYHLQKAQAHLEVSQQRESICRQLLSEQEVQAMSIDAARMNVEHHYQYIARSFEEFVVM